jgi:hypothetical protein
MRSEAVRVEGRPGIGKRGGARVIPYPRLRDDRAAAEVATLVARRRQVPMDQLLHRSRCKPDIAEARMPAMYLVHVMLGRTYSEVGRLFDRDRTTVAHACARIEDLRDIEGFEAEVSELEAEIGAVGAVAEARHAAG